MKFNYFGFFFTDNPQVQTGTPETDNNKDEQKTPASKITLDINNKEEEDVEATTVRESFGWIGHVNIGIILLHIEKSKSCLYNNQSNSDWLFNYQSRVMQVDL